MTEFLTEPEGMAKLAELAGQTTDAIVEIGVHQGGSLVNIAKTAKGPVFGVDPWGLRGAYPSRRMQKVYNPENQEKAQALLDEYGVEATLIRGFSTHVAANWDGPLVGLLYIDAVHTELNVLSDFRAWAPYLVPRAWVCFDDYNQRYPGVVKAVDRLCRSELEFVELAGTRLAVTRLVA